LEDDIDVIARDLRTELRGSIDRGAILGMVEGGCERILSDNDSLSVEWFPAT